MEEENGSINRPFPNRSRPLFQSKARWEVIDLKMIFYSSGGERPVGPAPPLLLDKTEARRCEKFFFRPPSPLLSQGLDDRPPPPLSEGLNPPLYSHANKAHFHMKSFALSLVLKVRVFGIRKWPIVHRKWREI